MTILPIINSFSASFKTEESMLYYTPPSDECFNELRKKAVELWKTYDDTYGYATGKVNRINNIENVGDNFMYIVAMFDIENQKKLADKLSEETKKAVRDRMIDGGKTKEFIVF